MLFVFISSYILLSNETNAPKFQKLLLVCKGDADAKDLMLTLYNGANGRMYLSLNLADREVFTVT